MFDFNFHFVLEGRKHDAGMLADSGLLRDLEQYAFSPGGSTHVCVRRFGLPSPCSSSNPVSPCPTYTPHAGLQ